MREYEIETEENFDSMVIRFKAFFEQRRKSSLDFKKIKIIAKALRKSKTSKQHRYYFQCIGQLQDAFELVGYNYTKDEIHEFIKRKAGYTRMILVPSGESVEVTKSIA
ncbi:unnamed protein product, partial [marine sediment metagenome]